MSKEQSHATPLHDAKPSTYNNEGRMNIKVDGTGRWISADAYSRLESELTEAREELSRQASAAAERGD